MKIHLARRGWVGIVASLLVAALGVLTLASLSDAVRERDGVTTGDPGRLAWFVAHRSLPTVDVARMLTEVGGVLVLVGIALAVAVVLWRRGQPLVVAIAPALSLALAGLGVSLGKPYFDRARPDVALRLVTENEPSFPSGHSADSTALLLAIGLVLAVFVLRRPSARVAAVALATFLSVGIGVSRLVLGVHWPTDVVAGWALGGAVALVVVTSALLATRIEPATGRGPGSTGRSVLWKAWAVATRVRRPAPPSLDLGLVGQPAA